MEAVQYEWVVPRRRRWIARILAVGALAAVVVAVVAIVRDGEDRAPAATTITPQLARLEGSAARLAMALGALRPGHGAGAVRSALHAAVADQEAAATAIRRLRGD